MMMLPIFWFWMTAAAIGPAPAELLISPLRGELLINPADREGPRAEALATSFWYLVGAGQRARLGQGGEAQVLCGTYCFLLRGPREIGPEICAAPPDESCELAADLPQRRARRQYDEHRAFIPGSLDWVGNARGDREIFYVDPVLLSPRCPRGAGFDSSCADWLAEPAEVLFVPVRGARQYRLRLGYPNRYEQLVVAAAELDCGAWPAWPSLAYCRLAWPASWRLPADGREVYLTLVAELETAGPARRASREPTRLALRAAPENPNGPLRGAMLGEEALLPEALSLLAARLPSEVVARMAQRSGGQPLVELLLAQAYFEKDLPELSREHFCHAALQLRLGLPGGTSPLWLAEAALGLARSDLELGRYDEAAELLAEAAAIFRSLRLAERLALSERLLAGLPKGSPKP